MKAIVATGFGEIDENIFFRDNVPKPTLVVEKNMETKRRTTPAAMMTIRVLACALAPGDVRLLSGKTDYFQLPASGHPYVVGSDVCGIVTEVATDSDNNDGTDGHPKFQVGDRIMARFDLPYPVGGLGEYLKVKTELCEIVPSSIPATHACTLPASCWVAKKIATQFVHEGDRVLLLGASGGVGTFLCQYVKLRNPSFMAATSTQEELVKSLGVDVVIDYRTVNWWELPDYQQSPTTKSSGTRFNVVFDLVNGQNWVVGGCAGKVIQPNAPYVAILPGVETQVEAHGLLDGLKLSLEWFGRLLWSRLHRQLPNWYAPDGLQLKPGDLAGVVEDVVQGRIKVILDPASPFEFSQEGGRKALALQKSIHAHGKVVVRVADDE